jgi:hypothetical protein
MQSSRIKAVLGLSAIVASAVAGGLLAVALRPMAVPRTHQVTAPRERSAARGERSAARGEARAGHERSARADRADPLLGARLAHTPSIIDWIAAGGGPTPEYNQLSVEDDLALFAETLGADRGLLLFAGGPGTRSVQVLDDAPRGDELGAELGSFFDARDGRDSHYRPTRLALHGPATVSGTLGAIERALATGSAPLTVFLAGHGIAGETPADAELLMWGDEPLTPAALAEALDRTPPARVVRVVITSCYSGGFGELVYRGARAELGPTETDRCGFFAAPWDLPASGCDPDPDRAVHEGYAIHFLAALRGQDRQGRDARTSLDLDHDGRISLLEAHTRAVIASTSLDVPTTTSETWLRAVAPARGPENPYALPEADAVVAAMAELTGLVGSEQRGRAELLRRRDAMAAITAELTSLDEQEASAYRAASAALLSRWPMLDDPWHPDFRATLDDEHDAIAAFFEGAPEMLAWREARALVDALEQRLDDGRVEAARYERLVRALDDRALAARLHAQGGAAWQRYERLLRCERGSPSLAPDARSSVGGYTEQPNPPPDGG